MGLAAPKVKTKVGLDPRNTFWTTNTDKFGHKYLSNFGWTPGTALGDKSSSYHSSGHITSASHTGVKIVLKDDTLGIGAKKGAQDGECTGLLGLEGLLGRLNGDDAKVQRVKQEEERRKQEWVGGRYGVRFVRGEVWTGEDFSKLLKKKKEDSDEEMKKEVEEKAKEVREDKKEKKKRKRGDEDEGKEKRSKRERPASEDTSPKRSKSKSKSKSESKTTSADEESSSEDTPAEASEDGAKMKKRKKSDKTDDRSRESKKERKKRKKAEKEERRARKAEKKSRKEKAKAQKEESSSSSDESDTETPASGSVTPASTASSQVQKRVLVGRHAIRARFIAAKRSAVMDSAALNEILMIKA